MTKKAVRGVNGLLRTLMNMPARTIGTLALILCLFGCVTGEKMSQLHPGGTKAEVVSALGRPDGYKQIEGHEIYRYSNQLSSGWSWDRADFNVVFKNDRVVEYGAGEVRPKSNGAVDDCSCRTITDAPSFMATSVLFPSPFSQT
jgi:hypothetical protein